MFGYVIWPNPEYYKKMENLLKLDNLYFKGIPKFVVAEIQQWPLYVSFGFAYFLVTTSYVITVMACVKVWKKLKTQSANFSEETRRLHKQMTKTMIMQATVPLFLVILPIIIGLTFAFGLINVPGMGMFVNSIIGLTPVANPLVTIISIKTYRMIIVEWIFKCFGITKRHKIISVTPSTVSSIKNANLVATNQLTKHS
uniref:Uncharacterized protein n=1 Tax=Panagrolaimus sp. PS1159 TaxID=55785 RepID=A0AC35GF46_9BILA